jgi:hypothetical protein
MYSSAKSKNKRVEQVLPRGRFGDTGRDKVVGKEGKSMNAVSKMCTHACK